MSKKANPKTSSSKAKSNSTKQNTNKDSGPAKHKTTGDDKKYPLPVYDEKDDIYEREVEQPLRDPEKIGIRAGSGKQKSLDEGLDIPGAELDDDDEIIGEEDEENNYYSIGGDRHEDLEEERD